MKLIGVLALVGLICAASAKLPPANRKYKFYLNRFFSGFSPLRFKAEPSLANHRAAPKEIIFSNIYF